MRSRQAVRQRIVNPPCEGSNPSSAGIKNPPALKPAGQRAEFNQSLVWVGDIIIDIHAGSTGISQLERL